MGSGTFSSRGKFQILKSSASRLCLPAVLLQTLVRDESDRCTCSVQVELALEELAPDENLDEELSMKKKAFKEKQQVLNRSRSELAWNGPQASPDSSSCRTCTWIYYVSSSGKKAIKVLHMLGKCYMLPGVRLHVLPAVPATTFPSADSYDTLCKCSAKATNIQSDQDSSGTNTSSSSEEER